MTVFSRRSKMISVRLSEEEYAALLSLCSVTGARSISDLTRDAMVAFLASNHHRKSLVNRANEFHEQIDLLHKKIEDLAALISSPDNRSKT
jgi:hypothetical protein